MVIYHAEIKWQVSFEYSVIFTEFLKLSQERKLTEFILKRIFEQVLALKKSKLYEKKLPKSQPIALYRP